MDEGRLMFDNRARLTRPHDGDSFWVLVDTGYRQRYEPELRLLDVYAPELRQLGGLETTEFINDWFRGTDARRSWPLYVQTVKTRVFEPDERKTLDRYLATVWRYGEETTGVSLNQAVNAFLAQHPDWPRGSGAPK